MSESYAYPELARLIDVVKRLRAPDGCPWDRAQTHESIIKNLVEESGEFIDALEDHNLEGVREELGDLLLQVLLHCQIASDNAEFDIERVASEEATKLIRRHPHVFGEKHAADAAEALDFWNASKVGEAGEQSRRKSPMDGVPRSMPGLSRIQKALRKAEKNSLHQSAAPETLLKELGEGLDAMRSATADATRGELLQRQFLKLTELCHAYGIEAEECAHASANDFISACKAR